jgi:3-deoxy-D-manno-octulosonate 8-phosphate phosphatase (KDO 8-P phosphatase)
MQLEQLCQPIRLMLCDVDGVLTDGGLVLDDQGAETKRFHIHDGMGIRLWRQAGYRFGLLTHRRSQAVSARAAELGVQIVRQGTPDKRAAAWQILEELGLAADEVCYVGDDLPDLATIRAVGLGVAVANAVPELRRAADYVTTAEGGNGAVRETIEMILKAQRRWDDLIKPYGT